MDFFALQRLREQAEQQTESAQCPPVHETKLVNTEIHDNHGLVVAGGTNTITIIQQNGKMKEVEVEEEPEQQPQPHHPRANDYIGLIQWLKEENIDWHSLYGGNRTKAAEMLSPIVQWTIDARTWARAENRQL